MSSTDVQKKTRLQDGASALIVNSPPEYLAAMSSISFDIKPNKTKQGKYDFIQVFGADRSIIAQLVNKYYIAGKLACLF